MRKRSLKSLVLATVLGLGLAGGTVLAGLSLGCDPTPVDPWSSLLYDPYWTSSIW